MSSKPCVACSAGLHAPLPVCLPRMRHPQSLTTCRAKPGRAKRGSAVNRALRARIKRKREAIKQEATQLPRLNCIGRRESVLCTNGIFVRQNKSADLLSRRVRVSLPGGFTLLKWSADLSRGVLDPSYLEGLPSLNGFVLRPPRTDCVSLDKTNGSSAEVLISVTVRVGGFAASARQTCCL